MMSEENAPAHGATPPQALADVTFENTWIAMTFAPLATPENETPAPLPLPAAMPATCVPCRHSAAPHGAAAPGPHCSSLPLGQNDVLVPAT